MALLLHLPVRFAAADRPAEQRADLFIVILLGLQRLSYLVSALAVAGSSAYHDALLNGALLAGWLAWNAWLFGSVRRSGWISARAVWLDVTVAAVLMVAVAANLPPEMADAAPNWTGRVVQASAALAGAALARLAVSAAAVALLLAVHGTVVTVTYTQPHGLAIELVSCLNGILWFAVVIGFAVRYLRRQGRLLDDANAQRLAVESRAAADRAGYETRLAHHRALHDTVLSTLIAISRGGLDHRSEQVRLRCARDADYVRRLLDDDVEPVGGPADQLARVVSDAELLGMRVHLRHNRLPTDLPADLVHALTSATREALNNVLRHAGVDEAWLTATWEDETLRITVVDRGRGFDEPAAGTGSGVRQSIVNRMQAAGGQAYVSATPGEGTCVELTWRT